MISTKICTSTLFCEPDIGSVALNMVGSLEGKSFIFNGVVLPKSPLKLEGIIYGIFDLIAGKSSDIFTKSTSMIYHMNNNLGILGDDLSFTNISMLNEQILNIRIANSTTPVGSIHLNTRSFKPTIIGYADSIKGLKENKERNDDSIVVLSMSYCYGNTVKKVHIGIVADGVSSLGRGYYVSSETIKIFTAKTLYYVYAVQDLTPNAVNDLYRETARTVLNLNINNNIRAATTFTAVVYPVLGKIHVVHVGDTRVYLFTQKELIMLTEDHRIPGTNTLTKAVGVKIDEPMIKSTYFKPGDSIVLVSDGVYSVVKEHELKKLFTSSGNPATIVSNVLATVKARKGRDDASIGVIRRLA